MRNRGLATFVILALLGLAVPGAHAVYEAPWSSFDFLTDQRWSQINNRLADQRLDDLRKSVSKSRSGSSGASGGKREAAVDRSILALGETASTDLSALRPYLAGTQLSEEQAAKVLAMYNQVAARLDVPFNDSASGIAAFLAGTYAAYTNKPFPDALYKPLYEQFAGTLASDGTLKKMQSSQRVEYYQRLVVVGMVYQLMQLDLQKSPQPDQIAAMRAAAESAFTEIAGISPERIQFTANGLAPR